LGEGATGLYTVVLNGPVGLLGRRASPWAASCRLISCRAGPALWAENEAQPSPTSCSCRPGPEKIVLGSCSCRAKKSCYGLAHGPRAKWPSIVAPVIFDLCAQKDINVHRFLVRNCQYASIYIQIKYIHTNTRTVMTLSLGNGVEKVNSQPNWCMTI
jgi:hypothetical protein